MRRPSPAMVIACLALVGAWVGPAVASHLITGRQIKDNTISSRDVRNRALTGADFKGNTITGRVVKGLSGRDLLDDSIDGNHVLEETLGKVPSAAQADTAASVGGLRAAKVSYARGASADAENVLAVAGLRVDARCTSGGVLEVSATTAVAGAIVRVAGVRRTDGPVPVQAEDEDFGPAERFDVVPGGADSFSGTLTYWAPDGATATLDFLAEDRLPAGRAACVFAGTALGG